MIIVINILLMLLAMGIVVIVGVFSAQCLAAFFVRTPSSTGNVSQVPRLVVLMPAHNEADTITTAISSVLTQLGEQGRLVVIADNCDDQTASRARSCGAEVIVRADPERRGKGYALEFGIDHISSEQVDPPEVVVLVDADTHVENGAIAMIAREAKVSARPVQACYLFDSSPSPTAGEMISQLAIIVKNLVRPAGLARLGLPCQLTGSGIAIPWPAIRSVSFDGPNIVEDMQLGIDLAIAGYGPRFCNLARVTGRLPGAGGAAGSQRRRWEHGHIQTLLKQTPRLLAQAFKQRRTDLFAMAMDLAVPPLSLLCLIWAGAAVLTVIAGAFGASWTPAAMMVVAAVMLGGSVLMAWAGFARKTVPLRAILAVPFYVMWKIPLYLAFAVKRQKAWVRTQRDQPAADKSNSLTTVSLCGFDFHSINERQCVSHIDSQLQGGLGGWVVTANLDHLRRMVSDEQYASLCGGATLVVADGMPLIWASRIQGTPLPGRVAGSNLVSSLSAALALRQRSVYLLGGDPGTAEAAGDVLQQSFQGLKIAGTYCPPIGFQNDPAQMEQIQQKLIQARPDLVYVALGSPKQEQLISHLCDCLPAAWWIGVGISFSFLCGDVQRAPGWMQRVGLEWLHRLIQEPKRLAGRYLVHGIPFAGRLFGGAALRRVGEMMVRTNPAKSATRQ